MKTILILGAGLSTSSLIRYLLNNSSKYNWKLRIVDQNKQTVESKINGHENASALNFDATKSALIKEEIKNADIVISMLPARFHVEVAKDCIDLKTNLITPSYISKEMKSLDQRAKDAGIVIMNEIGVDPGLDHMSAMSVIDKIKSKGGVVSSFKSFCGGLIAPESDNNPWNYKFTWNPRNVVLAGQGGAACFKRNGQYKYIPYNRLFGRLDYISVEGYGDFVGYANRDSLSYRQIYGLEKIPTIFRGTLRRPGFCKAWDIFIELGMTDDSYKLVNTDGLTVRKFVNSFLPYDKEKSVENKFKDFLRPDRMENFNRFKWLGLFEDKPILNAENNSPAQVLQKILVEKLSLTSGDKDMLVMVHQFEYQLDGKEYGISSNMVNIGEDNIYTSMSNTVGLPTAICTKMILENKIDTLGVTLPIGKDIYDPILKELEEFNIRFIENEFNI
ncbi:MAG: saccharopine dehydrogenase [Crocinitomicaceae bacterium]|nr:saccharopine dehydrogenase [Crocinitomicaceae bacterium]